MKWLRGVVHVTFSGAATALTAGALIVLDSSAIQAAETSSHTRTFTPEEFGAAGNGIRNDTKAVQAAIDAAQHRGIVLLPAGKTFRCTHSLLIPSFTTITGKGATSQLRFTWSAADGPSSGGTYYVGNDHPTRGNRDIDLSNFEVRGDGNGLPSGPNSLHPEGLAAGVHLRTVSRFTYDRLDIVDVPGISLSFQGSEHGLIEHNFVHNSGRDGITGTSYTRSLKDITITHNVVDDVGDDGIAINGTPDGTKELSVLPTHITVDDNKVQGWSSNVDGRALGRGIVLHSVTHTSITDNSIANTYSSGIEIFGATSDISVIGNSVTGAGLLSIGSSLDIPRQPTDGIDIDGAVAVVLKSNVSAANHGANIRVTDCTECSIQNEAPK